MGEKSAESSAAPLASPLLVSPDLLLRATSEIPMNTKKKKHECFHGQLDLKGEGVWL